MEICFLLKNMVRYKQPIGKLRKWIAIDVPLYKSNIL